MQRDVSALSTGSTVAARSGAGVAYALASYTLWGLTPAYWKQLGALPPLEITAWRTLFGLAVGLALLAIARRGPELLDTLRRPRRVAAIVSSALLIGGNWLVFIYAVQSDRVMHTSLGYYVNPLVSVALALAVLGERLRRAQWIAVTIAALGVAWWTLRLGGLPWISAVLAGSFALYGLVRKLAPVTPIVGFAMEMSVLAPIAALFLTTRAPGALVLPSADATLLAWVAASGAVTAAPLVFFSSAARRLPLALLGVFQYIAPSLALWLAVAVYREPFTLDHMLCFVCVGIALVIFSVDSFRAARSRW